MDIDAFRELLSPAGQEALQAAALLAPREQDFLRHFQALSRRFPTEMARAALETAILRGEAMVKFPFAGKLYFTRQALEQASAYEVSRYRAERFRQFICLADLGCSVGGDTLSLASLLPTLGFDRDALRLAMARANLAALNLQERVVFVQADLASPLPFVAPAHSASAHSLGIFFDPARRTAQRRIFTVEDYLPPLSIIRDWLGNFPALGVKLSPGVELSELAGYEAEVEFISLRGELKEAVLWFGPLRTAARRATLLPGPHTLQAEAGANPPARVSEPRRYLYEPDPAILRAGLVTDLAERLGAAQLDPDIAYLTAEKLTPTPFARSWEVEDWFPFQLKRLRAYLRQRGVGRVTVKKRGSPLVPERLIHELRLEGDEQRVIVLSHLRGEPVVLICNTLNGL